jgi:hypothetical protein
MINDPNVSDAEIAAQWSVDAVRAGRVELAEALMRIAAQAVRAARRTVDVPFAGHTRAEQPRNVVYTRDENGVPAIVDDSAEVPGIAKQGAAVTAIMRAPSVRNSIPEGRRCEAEIRYAESTIPGMCDQGVWWNEGIGRWLHVDGTLDENHYPHVPALG